MRDASQKPAPLEINLPADFRQQRLVLGTPIVVLLTIVSMLLLSAIQEPIGWSALAWFALLPWVIAAVAVKKSARGSVVSYLCGLVYFLANLYWLASVTSLGYIALCFYLAWYFVLAGYILRRIYLHRRWPFTFVLPVLWVAQEFLRATLMTGFAWLFLSHSQHASPRLIQLADTFGAYGITFLIAMVNGLLADLLLRPLKRGPTPGRRPTFSAATLIILTGAFILTAILYGRYRLDQGNKTIRPGLTVAAIQEVVPQYVKESGASDEDIFARHLALSRAALAATPRPQLIVWPETMAPAPLNREFVELSAPGFDLSDFTALKLSRSFDRQLHDLAAQGVALLIGTPSVEMQPFADELRSAWHGNAAILYLSGGQRFPRRYDKMHLVPFGEVVPFKKSWPWLYRLLNSLTPYDYEYTLDAGEDPVVFELAPKGPAAARFAVAICYEDVMPAVPRRLAAPEQGKKRIDFLLNISNDGWFVHGGKEGQPIRASAELLQHLVICQFRAVENRIGIVRSVNAGISAFIRPDGSVQTKPLAGSLPADPRARQAVAGFLTDRVYLDSRTSPYSRLGDTFAIACSLLAGLLLLDALRNHLRSRPHPSSTPAPRR